MGVLYKLKTYEEKKLASEDMFASLVDQHISETTPEVIDEHARRFAAQMSGQAPQFVPVVADQYGLYGFCADGVREKIRNDGGAIRYGWALWDFDNLMLTAEFHSVWQSPDGDLADITPKPHGEARILFAPDDTYPADFDFDKRPTNRRMRTYVPLNIDNMISGMKQSQRAYEERRAAKAGLSLAEWLTQKHIHDNPLVRAIEDVITQCAAHEAKQDTFAGEFFTPDAEFMELSARRVAALARMKKLASV